MIIYLSPNRENLIDNVMNKNGIPVTKYKTNDLENFITSNGKNLSHATHLIIDLLGLIDNNDEIVQSINTLRQVYDNAKLVVLADHSDIHIENKDLLRRIFERNVYNIVLNENEIEHCILLGKTRDEVTQFFVPRKITEEQSKKLLFQEKKVIPILPIEEVNEIPEIIESKEIIQADKSFRNFKEFINVGIAGTENHIGTTHNALLITKFLKSIGFKVCYLETTEEPKIFTLKENPTSMFNDRKNQLQFMGINMYSGYDLSVVMSSKYDFYVFDLGVLSGKNKASFLMRDIKILVSGSKLWELPKLENAKEMLGSNTVNILLNFSETEYVENPFETGVNLELYKKIFKDYIIKEEPQIVESKKRSWFRKGGG